MKLKIVSVLVLFSFALSIPLTFSAAAHAEDDRQVVRDTEGQIIHNTDGNCVRINWPVAHDPCMCGMQPVAMRHAYIAKEDRTVYFEFNSAVLTPESKIKLNSLAERIKSESDIEGAEVAGYADRIGTVSYNEALSKRRAEVVRNYLVAHEIVNTNVTKTRWFGKSEPSAHCPNKLPRKKLIDCLQPDRKVQVDIDYRQE